MQKNVIYVFILMMCWTLTGCSDSPLSQGADAADTEPGEYYSFVSVEGDYKVLKVLVVGENLIHVCYYNNVFKEEPTESIIPSLFFGKLSKTYDMYIDISGRQQTTGRKHVALSLKGWDYLQPEFLGNSEVTLNELGAYEEWKKSDRSVFPLGRFSN